MVRRRDVYMNKMQQRIYYSKPRDVRLIGSRRFGKTDGCIGPRIYTVSHALPQSTNIWLGNSRKQLYSRTVPGTIAAIERFYGLREGVHFGWGRPPSWVRQPIIKPKSWDNVVWFANGAIWQLVSLAVTGSANSLSVTSIVADECKFLPKSKLDGEVMPALSGITHPMGDARFTEANPLYKSTFFASDASLTARGNWLEKEEEKMDVIIEKGEFAGKSYRMLQEELMDYADRVMFYNELLRSAENDHCAPIVLPPERIVEIKAKAQAIIRHEGPFKILPKHGNVITKNMLDMCVNYHLISPDEAELLFCHKYLISPDQDFDLSMIQRSKKYQKHIAALQGNAFCFFRANTLDNIDILGEDYIAKMKRDLPPVVFAISILNMKNKKSNDGFYSNLDIENVHGYIPDDCPAIDGAMTIKMATRQENGAEYRSEFETPDFNALYKTKDCSLDGDVVDSLPLLIAGDWNANINWLVTGQEYKRDGVDALNILSSLFTKNERKLRELCADWHHYYKPHQKHNRKVKFFFTSNAKYPIYQISGMYDIKDVVISELTKFGWEVEQIDMGNPMLHRVKFNDINSALAGYISPAIRINRDNNEALIVALENAEVKIGRNGFEKDKSGEKLSEDSDEAVRREYRTDATDAFDDLWIGVKYHQQSFGGFCMP